MKYRKKPNNECPRLEKIRNRFCSTSSPSDRRYSKFLLYFQRIDFTRKCIEVSESPPAQQENSFIDNQISPPIESDLSVSLSVSTFSRFYSGCNRKLWHCLQADRKFPNIMCVSARFCFNNKRKMLQCDKGIFCDLKIYSISNSAVLDTKELIHKYKFFVDTMRSYIHGNSAESFDLSS